MRKVLPTLLLSACLTICGRTQAEDTTLESARAVVVRTVPEAGSGEVNAKMTEIRVTFSKPMRDGSWSWSMVNKETFPEMTGKPRYEQDKRTCVLPVKLEPGRTYTIWLNTEKLLDFKDAGGQPAFPYLLVFKTKS